MNEVAFTLVTPASEPLQHPPSWISIRHHKMWCRLPCLPRSGTGLGSSIGRGHVGRWIRTSGNAPSKQLVLQCPKAETMLLRTSRSASATSGPYRTSHGRTERTTREAEAGPRPSSVLRTERLPCSASIETAASRGDLWQDYDLVFPTTIGTPLDVSDLTYRSFRPLLGRAGLPRIRFHDLRHTYATLMLQVDAHPRTVQDILGHAEFGITMDTYTHPSLESQREPACRLDKLLDL